MRISLPAILTTLAAIGFGLDLFTQLGPQASESENLWQPQVSHHRYRQVVPPARFASAFSPSLARSDDHLNPLHSRVR